MTILIGVRQMEKFATSNDKNRNYHILQGEYVLLQERDTELHDEAFLVGRVEAITHRNEQFYLKLEKGFVPSKNCPVGCNMYDGFFELYHVTRNAWTVWLLNEDEYHQQSLLYKLE